MNTGEANPSTSIPIGKAPAAVPTARRTPFFAFFRRTKTIGGSRRGLAVFDFLLRLCAIAATVAAAIAMGTSDETLPFVTAHYQFYASYSDLPALPFFVIANAVAAGLLVLSLPLSIFGIVCPHTVWARFLLLINDLVAVILTTAAGAAAAAIVDLAHTGNGKAGWVAICLRFDGFCQQISGSVVACFVAVFVLMLLVLLSAISLKRKHYTSALIAKN